MKILVVNGPNLNMLGIREPTIYSSLSLETINAHLSKKAQALGVEIDFFQSNSEGEMVNCIQNTHGKVDGIIINAGAYTHTSIALRDALLATGIPFIEVHISNTFKRESFRHHSYLSDIAAGVVLGFGPFGYELALEGLVHHLNTKHEL